MTVLFLIITESKKMKHPDLFVSDQVMQCVLFERNRSKPIPQLNELDLTAGLGSEGSRDSGFTEDCPVS